MKYLAITINLILSSVFTVAIAANQQSSEIENRVISRLLNLNEAKLEALMNRLGQTVPDDLYSCLCHATGAGGVGGGVIYKPGIPCEVTGVLGGKSRVGFPGDSAAWKSCVSNSKYKDGTTIVDTIVNEIDAFHKSKDHILVSVGSDGFRSLLKNLFQKSCLPVPEEIDDLNPDSKKLKGLSEIANRNYVRAQTKSDQLRDIYWKLEKMDNICEAAIETKLAVESIRGNGFAGTLGSFIWTVYGIDEFTLAEKYAESTGKIAKTNPFNIFTEPGIKRLKTGAIHSAQAVNLLSYYDKYTKIKDLYSKEKKIRQENADLNDALILFRKSKTWNLAKLNHAIDTWKGAEKRLDNAIVGIKRNRDKKLSLQQLSNEEKQDCFHAKHLMPDDEKRFDYSQKCNKHKAYYSEQKKAIISIAEKEINERKLAKASALIKLSILEKHRKPLIEKPCNEYLGELLEKCPSNKARDKPLKYEDINRLWKEWKEDFRQAKVEHENFIEKEREIEAEKLKENFKKRDLSGMHQIEK